MGLDNATWCIFPGIDEKLLTSAKILHEIGQTHDIWKQQHSSFPVRGLFIQIRQVVQKLEPFKGWKLGDWRQQKIPAIAYKRPRHGNFSKLLGNV